MNLCEVFVVIFFTTKYTEVAQRFTKKNKPLLNFIPMSIQKQIVTTYMDGFRSTDHAKILACVTDDVIWEAPGFFYHEGREAFDKEIENPQADGHPDITITRLVEEGNVVVAEGSVVAKLKDGSVIDAVFCDVFHFRGGRICRLTTYLGVGK